MLQVNPLAAKCPRYNVEILRTKDFPGLVQLYDKYDDLFDQIKQYGGMEIPQDDALLTVCKISDIYDSVLLWVRIRFASIFVVLECNND